MLAVKTPVWLTTLRHSSLFRHGAENDFLQILWYYNLLRDGFQSGWLSPHLSMQGVKILLINEGETTTPSEKVYAKGRTEFAEFETELRPAHILRGIKQAKEISSIFQ